MAFADDTVSVTVTGRGVSAEAARRDALRKALERGGETEIGSRTEVRNYQLIRDSIFARVEGIVTDYDVLEKGEQSGGIYYCKVAARVSKSAVASSWIEVQNVLEQVGRPSISIFVQEWIDDQLQNGSILESTIEKRLLDAGFSVYTERNADRALAASRNNVDMEQTQRLVGEAARKRRSQIYIVGQSWANMAGVRDLYGEPTAMYNGDATIKLYYTDTGELLASESLTNWRGGTRSFHEASPQAGRTALANAGQPLMDRCYDSVMRYWATRITVGAQRVLVVRNLTFQRAVTWKKNLEELAPDRIESVEFSFDQDVGRYRLRTTLSTADLARRLLGAGWASDTTVVTLSENRLVVQLP